MHPSELFLLFLLFFFFFKQKTAYEISACLVGSEMCIRDSVRMDLLPSREEIAELYAKDDSIAFVDSILAGYERKKALLEHFMDKGLPAQTHLKRITGFER